MTLLVLGGTSDAKYLAQQLHQAGIPLIYSVAGKVGIPKASYPIISGGFSVLGGLRYFFQQKKITGVLDVTHPYALNITQQAYTLAEQRGLPYWRYERPVWQAQAGDQWVMLDDWSGLFEHLTTKKHILFTQGHLSTHFLSQLEQSYQSSQQYYLRTMIKPEHALPSWLHWIKSGTRFSLLEERQLMQAYQVDALVTKNSGGALTYPKLVAARELHIPVFMLKRPALSVVKTSYDDYEACLTAVRSVYLQEP